MAGSPGRETEKKGKKGKKDLNLIRCFSSTRLGEGKVLVSLSVLKWQKICLARRRRRRRRVFEKTFSEPTIPTQKKFRENFSAVLLRAKGEEEALTDFSHKSGAEKKVGAEKIPQNRVLSPSDER